MPKHSAAKLLRPEIVEFKVPIISSSDTGLVVFPRCYPGAGRTNIKRDRGATINKVAGYLIPGRSTESRLSRIQQFGPVQNLVVIGSEIHTSTLSRQ